MSGFQYTAEDYRLGIRALARRLLDECCGDRESVDCSIFEECWSWVEEFGDDLRETLRLLRGLVGQTSLLALGYSAEDTRCFGEIQLDWVAARWVQEDVEIELERMGAWR